MRGRLFMSEKIAEEWLEKAEADLKAAQILYREDGPRGVICFHAQQAVEKALKAILLHVGMGLKKTHSIREIKALLSASGLNPDISDENCRLLDALYLPSKYPLGGVLPDSEPDKAICDHCIQVATSVVNWARMQIK